MRSLLYPILILLIWLPTTISAQPAETDLDRREACVDNSGSVVISNESFRRCLADEIKASRYDDALDAAREATGRANVESGRRMEVEALLVEERQRSDGRARRIAILECQLEEAREAPGLWTGVIWGAAIATPVAVALTILIPRL